MIEVAANIPEFITLPKSTVDQLRELVVFSDAFPSVFKDTRFNDRVMEEVTQKQWELMRSAQSFRDLQDSDDVYNILYYYIGDNGAVWINGQVETDTDMVDFDMELRAAE